MPNYAFTTGKSLPSIDNGHVFERYNLTQKAPHTAIFTGKTGLIFRNCNLTNCDVPADATIENCSHRQVEFCTHIHPKWIAKGIAECTDNCSHVVDTDEIWIDGVLIKTIYHHQDKGVT